MYFSNKNCEHDYLSYASQAGGPAAAGAAARSSVARTGTRSPVRDLRRVRRPDTSAGPNLLCPRGAGDKLGNLPHDRPAQLPPGAAGRATRYPQRRRLDSPEAEPREPVERGASPVSSSSPPPGGAGRDAVCARGCGGAYPRRSISMSNPCPPSAIVCHAQVRSPQAEMSALVIMAVSGRPRPTRDAYPRRRGQAMRSRGATGRASHDSPTCPQSSATAGASTPSSGRTHLTRSCACQTRSQSQRATPLNTT